MAHNEDDFMWMLHHEDGGEDDSLTYINGGVAQWIIVSNTCRSLIETNLLLDIFIYLFLKNYLKNS